MGCRFVSLPFDYISSQVIEPTSCEESYLERGEPRPARQAPWPTTHAALAGSGLVRVFNGVKRLVRALVVLVYLFPALLVLKVGLLIAGSPLSDLITFGFVLLVVATFGGLALLAALFIFVGPQSKRAERSRVVLALPSQGDLARTVHKLGVELPAPTPPADLERLAHAGEGDARPLLRLRGKLVLDDGAADRRVLVDGWLAEPSPRRVFGGRAFAVVAEGQPVVVVELAAAPVVVADYREVALPAIAPPELDASRALALPEPSSQPVPSCVLSVGDEVELVVSRWRSAALAELTVSGKEFELRRERDVRAPYRAAESERVIVAECALDAPVVVRPLG
jgi:hypothetical protein